MEPVPLKHRVLELLSTTNNGSQLGVEEIKSFMLCLKQCVFPRGVTITCKRKKDSRGSRTLTLTHASYHTLV